MAWAERLKENNSVGRNGNFAGQKDLFAQRGDCLTHAIPALIWYEKDMLYGIWRCETTVDGRGIIGELSLQKSRNNPNLTGYTVGFDVAENARKLGTVAPFFSDFRSGNYVPEIPGLNP